MSFAFIATTIFIILIGIALYKYFSKSNQPIPVPPEEPVHQPSKPQPKQTKEQAKREMKRQLEELKKKLQMPMETAENYLNVGNTLPICLSFDPSGKYFIVCCKNRQQILYEVNGIPQNGAGKQRYHITDDAVIDCSLFRDDQDHLELAVALTREKSIRSFKLNETSNKSAPGQFTVLNAGNLTIDRIQVSPDTTFVAALGDETFLRVFQPDGKLLFGKDTSQMRNTEITVSSNSEFVTVSSYTSEIVVYGIVRDKKTNAPKNVVKAFTFSGHKNSIQTVDFDRNSLYLASGSKDHSYAYWLAPERWNEGDICRKQWTGSLSEPILIIKACPTMPLVACLTETGKLYFVDKSGIKKVVENAHNAGVNRMYWDPSGRYILVLSFNSQFIYAYSNPL
mgnify:CR=1 FL=1